MFIWYVKNVKQREEKMEFSELLTVLGVALMIGGFIYLLTRFDI